jgi:hypothetical protein
MMEKNLESNQTYFSQEVTVKLTPEGSIGASPGKDGVAKGGVYQVRRAV